MNNANRGKIMSKQRNSFVLVIFVITGVILGGLIGSFFGKALPILSYGPGPLGIDNFSLNLGMIHFNLTLLLDINVASLIGLLIAIGIFKRL